jgi:CheY-like chemotaxis protein
MDGWVVLDRLKHDPLTRHIPVHIISVDDSWQRGVKLGAFAFLKKPVDRRSLDTAFRTIKSFVERSVRSLLVVEDNEVEREAILEAVGGGDVESYSAATAVEALEALRTRDFDCMVLDLGLPDMNGFELLETVRRDPRLHDLRIVVYTGRDLTTVEAARLEEMAETTIVKDVRSLENLLEKTTLFLHRVEADLKPALRAALQQSHQHDGMLAGKRVLIVDDDLRNIFAMTSKLERWDMEVLRAENGRRALEILAETEGIDIVLMDIMMPEMDGYETMQAIRNQEAYRDLPIIALTAKAMKEDRRRCLEMGASDYLAKPVGSDQLFSMLRVWLYRQADAAGTPLGATGPEA